jgi:hypothetical protein
VRRAAVAVAFAVAVAAAVAWWGAPDTGAPLADPRAETSRPTARATVRLPEAAPGGASHPVSRAVAPPVLPTGPYDPDTGATAAVAARREPLRACWDAYVARAGDPGGRFGVELVLTGDGARTAVSATALTAEDDALDACVTAVVADAAFEPVTGVHRFLVPVP